MATAREQLEAMRHLTENWDGYQAAAPRGDFIDLAQEFVCFLEAPRNGSDSGRTIHVSPTRVGGILLEWEDPLREHEVEFCPDGSISFLHVNKATQEVETRRFSPGKPTVVHPGLIQELRASIAA